MDADVEAVLAGVMLFRRVGPLRLTDDDMIRMTGQPKDLLWYVRTGFEGAYKGHEEDLK